MKIVRQFLSNVLSIHIMVLFGLVALWGFIELGNKYLLLFVTLSFAGAICGGFVRVIDVINKNR